MAVKASHTYVSLTCIPWVSVTDKFNGKEHRPHDDRNILCLFQHCIPCTYYILIKILKMNQSSLITVQSNSITINKYLENLKLKFAM